MTKKEKFSIWNDPSFDGHDDTWWAEWFKNQHTIPKGTPMPLCEKCSFLRKDNTCMVFDYSGHISRICKDECEAVLIEK